PCGACISGRKGRAHLCPHVMREKVLGAFGQYLCIPAPVARQNLFSRPPQLSGDQAALLEPLACVVHGLGLLDWRGVERVLVLGLGVMGLLFVQLLPRYTNAACVGAGRRAALRELARRLGLRAVYSADDGPAAEALPAGERFDCVIECTGRPEGWEEAFG